MRESEELRCEVSGELLFPHPEEQAFYASLGIPLPRLSPLERKRFALARVAGHRLFVRPNSGLRQLAGEERGSSALERRAAQVEVPFPNVPPQTLPPIVSRYPTTVPFPVVSDAEWMSEEWDALSFGSELSKNEDFFSQLLRLWQRVPRPALVSPGIDSDPSGIPFSTTRSCAYDVVDSSMVVNSAWVQRSFQIADCLCVRDSGDCYECVGCVSCRELRWSRWSKRCTRSAFLAHCVDCDSCLFCVGLTGKQFCVWNKQVTEEEFHRVKNQWQLYDALQLDLALLEFQKFLTQQRGGESSVVGHNRVGQGASGGETAGDPELSFHENYERSIFTSLFVEGAHRVADLAYIVGRGDEGVSSSIFSSAIYGRGEQILSSTYCWGELKRVMYSTFCFNCEDIFGCVGLRNKRFCITNIQYSESEYYQRMAEIEEWLKKRGQWCVPLPPSFNDWSYNLSAAHEVNPLSEGQAAQLGFSWSSAAERLTPMKLIDSLYQEGTRELADYPSRVQELSAADLAKKVFLCEITAEPFQISPLEYSLYSRFNVPPPRRAFRQRHLERMNLLNL